MSSSNAISEKKVKYVTTGDLSFSNKDKFSKYVLLNDKEEYNKEKRRKDFDEFSFIDEALRDLYSDCDRVKSNGDVLYFVDYRNINDKYFIDSKEDKNTTYVLLLTNENIGDVNQQFIDVLDWYYKNDCANEIEIKNSWEAFDSVNEGIAYRGGSGYHYALYAKSLNLADYLDYENWLS